MNFQVSDESRIATTNCAKGFSCLTGDGENLCLVKTCISEKVSFIEDLNHGYCYYKQSYGNGHFCTCLIRKELCHNYGI